MMKLLLASAGIANASIRRTLLDLLGKPIEECAALCIPTASYALPDGPLMAWRFIAGREPECPMTELGWRTLGNLELSALPSLPRERWVPLVESADVLLVNGGDPLYLAYWMRESGLADLLPSYGGVYASLSAGSMVMAPRIGREFVGWTPPGGGDDTTLGLVEFAMFPHLGHPMLPSNTMAAAERWAERIGLPGYAMDDQTALRVVDGTVEVISEGTWHHFKR